MDGADCPRLAALPKPVATDFELELPEEQAEAATSISRQQEDAAERDRRNAAVAEAARQMELRRRSQVLKKDLPRLAAFDVEAFNKQSQLSKNWAYRTILEETALLVAHDNYRYPIGRNKPQKPSRALERINDAAIAKARQLLAEETAKTLPANLELEQSFAEIKRASLVPYGDREDEEAEHDVRTASAILDRLQLSVMDKVQSCNEQEKKLSLHFGGYQQRAKTLRQKLVDTADRLEKARSEFNSVLSLQIQEDAALAQRLNALRDEVVFLSRREREAQDTYRQRRTELEELRAVSVHRLEQASK